MIILPAIDLYDGHAVRLYKGRYDDMTVYDTEPLNTAKIFERAGATWLHMVDLEGAKTGQTANVNMSVVEKIVKNTAMSVEIGGGVRDMTVIERYLDLGVSRVILGTAAVTNHEFVKDALKNFGSKIAIGADVKDGFIAIKGWTESSSITLNDFCASIADIAKNSAGVCMICTDISKDGAMMGTNREMYRSLSGLSRKFNINFIASGGVSSLEDIIALRDIGMYGAIIGKAYYTGAIDIKEAVEVAK